MRVLITGATGFLGKYILEEFALHNCEIVAFGRNAQRGMALKNCTFIQGDFTNYEEIEYATRGIDIVIHAGALCTVWGQWSDFFTTNVLGTLNVLRACREHGVKKFVYVSSCSIYNCTYDRLDIAEDDFDQSNELNYYIKSKIQAEQLVMEYAASHNISYAIIRPHGIFGVGDTSIMPRLLRVSNSIGIPLFRGGSNLIDIVCAENVAYALWLCANSLENGVYNITNGEVISYKELVSRVFLAMGINPRYLHLNFNAIYALTTVVEAVYKLLRISQEPLITKYTLSTVGVSQTLSISRARKVLGYEPKVSLQEGIYAYAKWWKTNQRA